MKVIKDKFKKNPVRGMMAMLLPVVFVILPVTLPRSNTRLTDAPPVVTLSRAETTQGGITGMELTLPSGITPVSGSFAERKVSFFKGAETDTDATYHALLGADLTDRPALQLLELTLADGPKDKKSYYYSIAIEGGDFTVDRLTLPPEMVNPGKKARRRIRRERKDVAKAVQTESAADRLWESPFIMPVSGKVTSSFGRRRILNGQEKSPHSGVDIRTPKGRRIRASNRARVAFTGYLYYTGKTVILDHGQGLFTSYCHLSKIKVKKGDMVARGKIVGLAGSTGRSTGPHLHWSAKLQGARVSPLDLVSITEAILKNALQKRAPRQISEAMLR
ncbi:Phage endopeptidase (ACLAME 35) [hydrothermal vent metagenome]|uniref:Phage endopeptidase (ACLAME 35) n=1 Tax=hydrothermal vent metagenome TaxID=652676 RepID=A0A3B0QQ19_9ZZZZ